MALDMATCSGWCSGDGQALPTVGHILLPKPVDGARGPMFTAFRRAVIKLIEEERPDLIVGEQSILPAPKLRRDERGRSFILWPVNIETTMLLQGLWAILEQVADAKGIECGHVDVSTVKKELAGYGGADKDDMVYVARKIGLEIAVHDEADALGVWLAAGRLRWSKDLSARWDRLLYSSRGALL